MVLPVICRMHTASSSCISSALCDNGSDIRFLILQATDGWARHFMPAAELDDKDTTLWCGVIHDS